MRSYARSVELYQQTRETLAGGVSSNVRYASTPVPLFFERGEGARLHDVDGNVHIDYVLGNGPAILGHAPKPVIEAVARSLVDGQVYAAQHPRETALARRLCRLLPGVDVVRFASSGTEAVLMALRLARAFTGREKILKFEGHYHGWSDQAYISARPALNEAGPADAPVPVAGSPGMPRSVLEDVVVAGWNDLEAVAAVLERHRGEIAGVLMEPVMVNGGAALPAEGYLAGVCDLCRSHGALFICDEVITGFRAGLRGAQGRFGVTADLAVYAKAVAAGFPLALVGGRRDVMDTLADRGVMHGGTYNGNVQSMAAAIAALDELERDDGAVYRALEQRGTRLMDGLRVLASRHGVPMRVEGLPAIFQTFFTEGPAPRNYREAAACDRDRALAFHTALQDEGVRVTQAARWFLSTAHDDGVIDETLAAADRALAAVGRQCAESPRHRAAPAQRILDLDIEAAGRNPVQEFPGLGNAADQPR
jgi:glutamate-1-semialdehyde 2,1-aminomutase